MDQVPPHSALAAVKSEPDSAKRPRRQAWKGSAAVSPLEAIEVAEKANPTRKARSSKIVNADVLAALMTESDHATLRGNMMLTW